MILPNVVVAGAPKCGTSSLFVWLVAHPAVCGSPQKETRYLMDRSSPLRQPGHSYHDGGLEAYSRYFSRCGDGETTPSVIMEATPDYLYQDTAREVLARLTPKPLIVFLFRRPSSRIYSLYQFARNNMALLPEDMDFGSFVDAARRQDEVLAGRRNLARALDYSRYADYLAQWITSFGLSGIRCYLTEALQADPLKFMQGVALDLNINPDFYIEQVLKSTNETYLVRSRAVQRARLAVGSHVRDGKIKHLGRALVGRLNNSSARPSPTDRDRRVLAGLDDDFGEPNARLASMAGLDIDRWW